MATPSRSRSTPRLTINVTQELIDKSTVKDSSHCMIAEAVKEAFPKARHVAVDLATIRFTDPGVGLRYIYLTPRHVQEALLDFDQGVKPEPFSLQIRAAQTLPSGTGKKGRARLERAEESGGTPHIRVGGKTPPIGPLTSTSIPNRTGRRREFGLRAITK